MASPTLFGDYWGGKPWVHLATEWHRGKGVIRKRKNVLTSSFTSTFQLTFPRRFIGLYTDFGTSCRIVVKCIINSKTVRIVLIWVKPVSTLWVCFVRFGANISIKNASVALLNASHTRGKLTKAETERFWSNLQVRRLQNRCFYEIL